MSRFEGLVALQGVMVEIYWVMDQRLDDFKKLP